MAKSPSVAVRRLPWWAPLAGSALLVLHLLAVGCLALAARSGPWPVPYGMDTSPGPQFAESVKSVFYPVYLRPLAMTSDYHFQTSRTSMDGVRFEIVLRDDQGKETKRLKFPDPSANFWVRHRQQLLAQGLANDIPTQERGTDKVAAKGGPSSKQTYWLTKDEVNKLVYPGNDENGKPLPSIVDAHYLDQFPLEAGFKTQPTEHMVLVPVEDTLAGNIPRRPQPIYRPASWPMLLVKSYLRHACEQHQAHSAELIRYSRPAVLPNFMDFAELPPQMAGFFTESIAHYGDLKLDLEEVQK